MGHSGRVVVAEAAAGSTGPPSSLCFCNILVGTCLSRCEPEVGELPGTACPGLPGVLQHVYISDAGPV